MGSGFAVNNVDDRAGFTANRQIDWATTDRAVLNQRLFGLGGVDLHRKKFAAMQTSDVNFDEKLHISDE